MRRLFATGRAALALVAAAAGAVAGPGEPAPAAAAALLGRMSRAADLYLDAALRFTCLETIKWNNLDPGGTSGSRKFDYIFVYDEDNGFQDYRSFHGAGGPDDVPREVSPDEFGIPRFVRRAYLWILIFREARWRYHDYRVLGEDVALDHPAIKIAFDPHPPYRANVNEWHGVAWVDRETAQLLRIEAHRREDERARLRLEEQRELEFPERDWVYIENFAAEFGVEKNGMRFPSLVRIEGKRYRAMGPPGSGKTKRRRVLKVEQLYRDYKFFGVRTADEIRKVLAAEP